MVTHSPLPPGQARELGFSLEEIKALLTLSSDNREDCNAAQAIADQHLKNTREKIADLQQLENVLSNLSVECQRVESAPCPILKSLNTVR